MITREDMEDELTSQLQVAANSSLFTSARKTSLIQNAYEWATNMFVWPDLVKAKTGSTKANYEYYDYPSEFRSNTIMRLVIDSNSYDRKNYEDYLQYKEDNSTTTKKMFSSYGRFFFVNPTPSSNGSGNMDIWGAVQADSLDDSTDTTIFSYNNPEGNEAIVQRAFGVALKRINPQQSKDEVEAAIATLAKLNADQWKATQRDQRLDHPKFDVPNYFGNNRSAGIGKFAYQP